MPIKLYSVKEAAAYLGLKPETIKYHLYQSGYLKGQLVAKTTVFTQEELDNFRRTVPKPGRKASKPEEPDDGETADESNPDQKE